VLIGEIMNPSHLSRFVKNALPKKDPSPKTKKRILINLGFNTKIKKQLPSSSNLG